MGSNYPGNTANLPTALTLPADTDHPEMANLGPPWEGNRDGIVYVNARELGRSALNWSELLQVSTSYPTATSLAWDGTNRKWLAGASNAAHTACGVWINAGLDSRISADWTELGGSDIVVSIPSVFVADVLADPNNANVYLAAIAAPSVGLDIYRYSGGTWTLIYGPAANGSSARFTFFVVAGPNRPYRMFVASAIATSCGVTDSADGVTWADVASTYGGSAGLTHPATGWSTAQSGESLIGVPQQTLSDQVYLRVTGPDNYTRLAFTAGLLVPTDIPYAIAYGSDIDPIFGVGRGVYLVAVHPSTGGTTFVASYDDGLTWSFVSHIAAHVVVNMLGAGSLFLATTEETAGGPNSLIFSIDGGLTWHPTNVADTNVGGSPAYYQQPRLVSSDVGFGYVNTVHFRVSAQWGIPGAIS
jgi:hypothetical protein